MRVETRRSRVEVDGDLAAKLADEYQAGTQTLGSITRKHGYAVRLGVREILHARGVHTCKIGSCNSPSFAPGSHVGADGYVYSRGGDVIGYAG